MWWEPENEEERTTVALLNRLRVDFLEPRRMPAAVHGIGSTLGRSKRRHPIIAVDSSLAPEWLRPKLSAPPWSLGKDPTQFIAPLSAAGEHIAEMLRRWELPQETDILFSPPARSVSLAEPERHTPAPLLPGTPVHIGQRRATIGFPILVRSQPPKLAFVTAGHLVPPDMPGRPIMVEAGVFRPRPVGVVWIANDPLTCAGVDAAAVELFAAPQPGADVLDQVFDRFCCWSCNPNDQPWRRIDWGTTVWTQGATSGLRRGWTDATAFSHTRDQAGRIWTNTWYVYETDRGFAAQGDSGAVVGFEPPGKSGWAQLLGHLVGVCGVARGDRYQIGIVQDAATIIGYLEQEFAQTVFAPMRWKIERLHFLGRARRMLRTCWRELTAR
jgi:hypothetical protein